MGFALSRALMFAMGGEIGVDSEVGTGSSFWITLPRGTDAMPPELDKTSPRPRRSIADASATVLHIEDNPANQRLVERLLDGMPRFRLIMANRGRIGLELARDQRPHVVLLDLHLPDIDGWEVVTDLRSNSATAAIPIIILTADASESRRRSLMEGGVDAYLTKPVDLAELADTIERLVDGPARSSEALS